MSTSGKAKKTGHRLAHPVQVPSHASEKPHPVSKETTAGKIAPLHKPKNRKGLTLMEKQDTKTTDKTVEMKKATPAATTAKAGAADQPTPDPVLDIDPKPLTDDQKTQVHEELLAATEKAGLSDSEVASIEPVVVKAAEKLNAYRDTEPSREDMEKAVQKLRDSVRMELKNSLTADQLAQWDLRIRGKGFFAETPKAATGPAPIPAGTIVPVAVAGGAAPAATAAPGAAAPATSARRTA